MGVGNCGLCFHPLRAKVEAFMRDGGYNETIRKWMLEQKKSKPDLLVPSKRVFKRHREEHLGLAPLQSKTPADHAAGQTLHSAPDPDASNEDIYAKARARLAGKLDDLSPKELHTLVIEGMKLERAKAAAKAATSGEDEGDDPEAAADAARAVARLHQVAS